MATKRGASWQGIVYHQSLAGGRVRRNFAAKNEAEAWELESKAKLKRGEPIDMGENVSQSQSRRAGEPVTLNDLVEHVARSRWAAKESGARQADNARSIIKLIGPNKPIAKLTKTDIDAARGKLLQAGNQPATVNRKVAALSTCLSEAVDSGLIAVKPKCAKYKEAEHRIRRFTPKEETAALTYFERMGEGWMADFIALSLDTGLRQGEMLNLAHSDADGRTVTVWGTGAKSGKTRSVPLTARAKGILERRKAEVRHKLVFEGVSRFAVAWQWEKLSQLLSMEDDVDFVPHILRHEFCSRLADRDMNAAVIQQLAGHSTLAITQRYIHVHAAHLVRAINALEVHTGINP